MDRNISKNRLEAITDGIIAIAATIMVLELRTPSTNDWNGLLEMRTTLTAYVISFFMIYIVWRMHHDLFKIAEVISRKTFVLNGIWLFFLTLVPFTTAWVGSAPDDTFPAMLYPMNLLMWSLSFHLMIHQIEKDHPETKILMAKVTTNRVIMYVGFIISIALAFVYPVWSMRTVGIVAMIIVIRLFVSKKSEKDL